MAVKGDETRMRLIEATRDLIEAKGYHGTGLNEVLAASGAPRGSLYHHFPGGKDQLVGEALTRAGKEIDALVRELSSGAAGADELVHALLGALADRMEAADYAKGCPVATVALEVSATHEPLRRICADVYGAWERALADALCAEGRPADEAEELSGTVLALIEGALVLARARRSRTPVERARRRVRTLLAS
ncbi:TetR/AcrR family transcriptional regulator [Actinoallomurus iriomotensis]|nr:TetR/AcrR family transcriptional regulator [Actinoallomurus iriomotensis]